MEAPVTRELLTRIRHVIEHPGQELQDVPPSHRFTLLPTPPEDPEASPDEDLAEPDTSEPGVRQL